MGQCTSGRSSLYLNQVLQVLENTVVTNDAVALDGFLQENIISPEEMNSIFLLHNAAESGFSESIRVLLESGVNVNIPDFSGFTPLHCAVLNESGAPKCIPLLIKSGAEVNSTGGEQCQKTPLHIAIEKGYLQCVDTLIQNGCNTNVISNCDKGISPLLLAIQYEDAAITEAILRGGADIRKCWIWKSSQTPPLDVLSHRMSGDCNREECIEILNLLIQADGNIVATLCQMPKDHKTKTGAIRIFDALKAVLKRLEKHHHKQAQDFIMSLICSGFHPWGEIATFLKVYDLAIYEILRRYLKDPPSLKDLCVRVIRNNMQLNVLYGVEHLPGASKTIKELIQIKHPPQPCLIFL